MVNSHHPEAAAAGLEDVIRLTNVQKRCWQDSSAWKLAKRTEENQGRFLAPGLSMTVHGFSFSELGPTEGREVLEKKTKRFFFLEIC